MFCSFSANGFLTRLRAGAWINLFDGHTFSGWSGCEGQDVDEGRHAIALLSKGKNLWIANEQEFQDFELTVETQMPEDAYNAGIAFRCKVAANGRPKGYQCEVAELESGMLYAIGSGGWIAPRGEVARKQFFETVGDAYRTGKWNHFRIRCEGQQIRIWVNGILTTDVQDERHASGRIALQHHGKGGTHYYRNIQIRRLNAGFDD